jgi:hypothetical protein
MSDDPGHWNWKNSLVSFLVGFVAGRVTKRQPQPTGEIRSSTSGPDLFDEQSTEEFTHASLMIIGLLKEASEAPECRLFDLADKYAANTAPSPAPFDSDAMFERALARAKARVAPDEIPSEHEIEAARASFKSFGDHLTPLLTSLLAPGVSAVPPYASPRVYDLVFLVIDKLIHERAPQAFLSEPQLLPELEGLLMRWTRDSKPETYTRPMLHAITVLRGVRAERHLSR